MIVAFDCHYWAPTAIATAVNVGVLLVTVGMLLLTRRTVDQQKKWIKYQGTANFAAVSLINQQGAPGHYLFEITNAGPAVARYCDAWIGEKDGAPVPGGDKQSVGATLPVGGTAVKIGFVVRKPFQELRLWVSWIDGNGIHEKKEVACPGFSP